MMPSESIWRAELAISNASCAVKLPWTMAVMCASFSSPGSASCNVAAVGHVSAPSQSSTGHTVIAPLGWRPKTHEGSVRMAGALNDGPDIHASVLAATAERARRAAQIMGGEGGRHGRTEIWQISEVPF